MQQMLYGKIQSAAYLYSHVNDASILLILEQKCVTSFLTIAPSIQEYLLASSCKPAHVQGRKLSAATTTAQ
jgi:hypothetical protein